MNNQIIKRLSRIIILLSLILIGGYQSSFAYFSLEGQVIDSLGEPIIGVSVIALDSGRILSGTATDTQGYYFLRSLSEWPETISMRFSSIGYKRRDILNVSTSDSSVIKIILKSAIQQITGFKVSSKFTNSSNNYQIQSSKIMAKARTGLVPTNLAGAIQSPGVSRAGSSHSAQLRIHGSSPMYYYNDLPLGYDPNHYGMFTILPAPAISKTSLFTLGTSAEYGLPAVISLTGERRFKKHHGGSFQVSTLDATANYSIGTGSEFLSATVRKSVLDKLIDRFSLRSEKRTLPPTNFQDVIIAGGKIFSPGYRVRLDGFYTRDFLAYNTNLNSSATKVSTRQHSEKKLFGVHLDHIHRRGIVTASLAVTKHLSEYFATPNNGQEMFVDLTDKFSNYTGRIKADFNINKSQLTLGTQTEIKTDRKVSLKQNNWNFLSPFSNSDNPYIFQQALNQNYGDYQYFGNSNKTSVYASYRFPIKSLSLKTGIRWESYSNLLKAQVLSFRGKVSYPTVKGTLELFAGTFNESPVNNILEPYQIQILANLNNLKPIHKQLISLSYYSSRLKLAAFHKVIRNLPSLTPNFNRVFEKDGSIRDDFIIVESTGKLKLWGGTLEFDLDNLFINGLNGSLSYGYTDAYQQAEGITVPYELEAPHSLLLDLNHDFSSKLMLGAKYTYRSGYPYTPAMTQAPSNAETYNEAYYSSTIGLTNSERFAPHASLDFFGHYQTGRIKIFWSISNLTNRSNPIISSHSGYIYDAGILPTIGFNFTF